MGLERYLCVGGVEVANPNRTLAYLRRLGSSCLQTPPNEAQCGCTCPAWAADSCAITVDLMVNSSDPEQGCFAATITDGIAAYSGALRVFPYTVAPIERPPTPGPTDPGWAWVGVTSFAGVPDLPLQSCGPYPDPTTVPDDSMHAGFFAATLTHNRTGHTIELMAYGTVDMFRPGALLGLAWSFDGGATWEEPEPGATVARASHTFPGVGCGAPSGDGGTVTGLVTASDTELCLGLLSVTGLVGPFSVGSQHFPEADPTPANWPGLDAAGWVVEGPPETRPAVPFPLGSCWPWDADTGHYGDTDHPLPEDGYWVTQITDLATGAVITIVGGVAYSTAAPGAPGVWFSAAPDDPSSWVEATGGVVTLPWGAGPDPAPPDGPPSFTTPADDDAPWYDPAVPASADVLGVWLEEARLGLSHSRNARQKARWGSTLGSVVRPGREVTLIGYVYTRSEAGTAYARQWLYEVLHGGSCGEATCDLPSMEVWTHCDDEATGQRFIPRVGLTSWTPDTDPTFPRRCGFKFEAVMTSETPNLCTAPFQVVGGTLMDGVEVCNICSPCPEPDPAPITCGCLATPLREAPEPPRTDCFCSPTLVRRTFVEVLPPRYWSDAVPVITIDVGSVLPAETGGLSNLRIRGWINPVQTPAPTDGSNPWECHEPCLDVEVACVPERAKLVIDGTTRRATLYGSNGQQVSAFGYLSSSNGRRFQWPEVSCHGLVLCIDADALHTPAAATARVEFVTIERG